MLLICWFSLPYFILSTETIKENCFDIVLVRHRVRVQVRDEVRGPVQHGQRAEMWNPIRRQVRNSLWHKVQVKFMQTIYILGKGQNYENQNVENQKELRKLRRWSERQNGLFSWSERRNQNVENVFWVDQNSDNQNIENSIKNQKLDFRRSDFTYGFKTYQNVENLDINYLWRITHGYQGLWGVGLGSIRLV
jgi:hypothetical protein